MNKTDQRRLLPNMLRIAAGVGGEAVRRAE